MFNDRLRATRISRGATQQKTADAMGVPLRHYQKYESGIFPIPVDRLEILADFYETSTDYILGRTTIRKPYPKK